MCIGDLSPGAKKEENDLFESLGDKFQFCISDKQFAANPDRIMHPDYLKM